VEIFERLYNETWENLRSADQLALERAKQNIFHGFNEGLLSFPPTYKYQPGTDLYEQRPDKKLRAPAWCDRVLWRSTRMDRDVTMLHYRAAPLHMSDHKPVSAMFICNTRKVLKDKLKLVYADLLVTVDKWINESKPKVEVTNRQIELGPIVHNVSYMSFPTLLRCLLEHLFTCRQG
jgi:phosphatidylinositol-bisphosphatase